MFTSDIALITDPAYRAISENFHKNPDQLAQAFAEAWFKLTHRDMGPITRYLGSEVPNEPRIWMDPVPVVDHPLIEDADISLLKTAILDSGLSIGRLVATAWASASTFAGRTSAAVPMARASLWRRNGLGGQRSGRTGQGPDGLCRDQGQLR
jgi:catalase-peroxidase